MSFLDKANFMENYERPKESRVLFKGEVPEITTADEPPKDSSYMVGIAGQPDLIIITS